MTASLQKEEVILDIMSLFIMGINTDAVHRNVTLFYACFDYLTRMVGIKLNRIIKLTFTRLFQLPLVLSMLSMLWDGVI